MQGAVAMLRKATPMALGVGGAFFLGSGAGDRVFGSQTDPFQYSNSGLSYPTGPVADWTGVPQYSMGAGSGEEYSRYEKHRPITHFDWEDPDIKQAFSPDEYRKFPLQWSRDLNHNTKVCRFLLPSTRHKTGCELASCIVTRTTGEDGKKVERPYTPISQSYQYGFFDLLVKRYPEGKMSKHIHSLQPGEKLEVIGPYDKIKISPNDYATIGMVAGGTGITPMYQVLVGLLRDPRDKTNINLVYANDTPDDILLVRELTELARKYGRFRVYFVVREGNPGWVSGIGLVNKEMLKAYLPAPGEGKVLVCGPPPMVEAISGKREQKSQGPLAGLLKDLGYSEKDVYKF